MFEENDTAKLMEEIDRYLAAVDLFRAQGCEPTWRPQLHSNPTRSAVTAQQPLASDIQLH
jgi:hypothetical protein